MTAPRSKYGAVKTTVNGITFDSKAESQRYTDLYKAQLAGEISGLQVQASYPLEVNGVKLGRYVADFVYMKDGTVVTEDVKGVPTPVYRLKKKLMLALWGITIQEVR
jgi:hypothetical protein